MTDEQTQDTRYTGSSSSDEPDVTVEDENTKQPVPETAEEAPVGPSSTETETATETATETEVEETESDESVEAAEDNAEAGDDETEADDGDTGKRKGKSLQARINELTRARREAERRVAEAEERAAEAERKAREFTKETPAEGSGPPDPTEFRFGEVDPEYIAALVDYRSDLREAARAKEREAAEKGQREAALASEIQTRFQEVIREGEKKYSDFVDVVAVAEAEQKFAFSREIGSLIVTSPQSVDLIYYLAGNPDAAVAIAAKSPFEQALELGRLEARFGRQSSVARKVSKSPEPIPTARGNSSGGSPDVDKMSGEEYLAYLQGRRKARS